MKKMFSFLEHNTITSFFLNREYFSLIYITVCILWFFPLLGGIMNPISKICFVWGAGLVFWDLITHRKMFQSMYWACPIAIIGLYVLTILINWQFQFYMGIKHLVYLCISLLLLYGQDRKKSIPDLKKLLYRVNQIIICIVFLAGIVSIGMFVAQFSLTFYRGELLLRQGFLENRLFGVYTSPNTGALFVVISYAAMIMNHLLQPTHKKRWLIFYIVNSVVQFIYFALTLSNGGMMSILAFGVLLIGIWLFPKMQEKRGFLRAGLASVVLLVILLSGLTGLIRLTRTGMSYVPGLAAYYFSGSSSPGEGEEPDPTKQDKIHFQRIESGDDQSNGRFVIWKGSLKALAQHPVFGYADMWVSEEDPLRFDLTKLSEEEAYWLYKHNGNLHNAYVHIAVYSGLVGFAAFALFAVLLIKKLLVTLLNGRKNNKTYDLLAVLFCVLGAIAVNGLVEAHLLYTRQDPYGAIFWIYLGIAVVLAQAFRYSDEYTGGKGEGTETVALVADTPLQVRNCVRFVAGNAEESAGKADLYVYHQFRGSRELAQRTRESGVFCHVYDVEPFAVYRPLRNKLATVFRMFFPAYAISRQMDGKGKLSQKVYRTVCVSFPTPMTIGLHRAFPGARVVLLEDGLGSYFGNLADAYSSGLFRVMDQIFFDGELNLCPQVLYLSEPALNQSTVNCPVLPLPPMNGTELNLEQQIFDYTPNDCYRQAKAVYLTQPLEEMEGFCEEYQGALNQFLCDRLQDRMVVRVHPRQSVEGFASMKVDPNGNLWELECACQISDDHVLLGACSTAQFAPRLFCGKEPAVIFLYHLLFQGESPVFWEGARNMIAQLRSLYTDPKKIYEPKTMKQLEDILSELGL